MSVSFSHRFNVQAVAAEGGSAQFGTNVLAGLVDGIDTFRHELERRRRSRSLGPGMLGAFLWVDDAELLRRIAEFQSGLWTQDPGLVKAAQKFLVEVVAQSEELDPDSNTLTPDLVEPDYDDEEMWEAYTALADGAPDESHRNGE
ncbi:hypothetical protein ACH47C_31405 [Streptomyces rishiriensis]|uniref:hypothetical protein n=1 Tax=Streptomyces rishiriensis TaxID=68264 RepID=UPI0033E6E2D7